jgi:hypothetical protein
MSCPRLLLLSLIILIISCKNQSSFIIEGSLTNENYNGSIVYLVALDAPVTRNVDSTFIRNGRFTFKLKPDSTIAKIVRVPLRYPFAVEDLVVIPETGILNVKLSENSHGEGTRLNEVLQQWKDNKHIYDSLQGSLFMGRDVRTMKKDEIDSLMKISGSLKNSFMSEVMEIIDENQNNGIGLLLFKVYFELIPVEKREAIIKQTNAIYFRKDAQLKGMIQ